LQTSRTDLLLIVTGTSLIVQATLMTLNDFEIPNTGFSEFFATPCCDAHLKSEFWLEIARPSRRRASYEH